MGSLIDRDLQGKSYEEQTQILDQYASGAKRPTSGGSGYKDPRPLGDRPVVDRGDKDMLGDYYKAQAKVKKKELDDKTRSADASLGKVTPRQQLADSSEQGITAGKEVDYALGADSDQVEGGDIDIDTSEGGGRKRKRTGGSGSIRV